MVYMVKDGSGCLSEEELAIVGEVDRVYMNTPAEAFIVDEVCRRACAGEWRLTRVTAQPWPLFAMTACPMPPPCSRRPLVALPALGCPPCPRR